MKKKIVSLVLAGTMMAMTLAGCGASEQQTASSAPESQAASSEAKPSSEAPKEEAPKEEENLSEIEKIIKENTTGKKLSDQKIADALAKEGIMIARRTVSKYRQEMALDSSRDR